MNISMLKSKLHRVKVTQAEPDYIGSVTIDLNLMEAAGILEYEKVHIANIDNGERLETYVIAGERGSGIICLNGAAARCVSIGDKVIIMSYCLLTQEEAKNQHPTVVLVDENNQMIKVAHYEKHGRLK